MVVHRAIRCAQVLYLSIHRIGDPGIWVVYVYASMVLGYGEIGEYISLSTVEVVGGRW